MPRCGKAQDASATAVEPPPPTDPELTRPLTPLDQLQVRPAPAGPSARPPAKIAYRVRVEGLDGTDLQRQFRASSALEEGHGVADDSAQIQARAQQDQGLLDRLMKSEGYYDGHTDVAMGKAAAGTPLTVALAVTLGPQYRLGTIRVTGAQTRPSDLPRQALDLKPGEPLLAAKVLGAEARVKLKLPEEAYPFVELGQRDVALDEASHTANYTLPVDPGPRSSFGRLLVTGQPVFKPEHLSVIARFKQGQLYDSRMVEDLRQALVATQLYGELGVEPIKTSRPGPDGTTQADIRIQGTRGKSHVLSVSAGYDTGLGATVQGSWTALNLWPPEGALTASGKIGTQQQQAGLTFTRSNFGQRDRSLTAAIQGSRQYISAFRADTGQVSVGVSRESTPIWQKRWTYSVSLQGLLTSESAYDIFARADVRRLYEVVGLPLALGYDSSDSLLNPTRGFRVKGQLSPEVSVRNGASPYVKAIVEGDGYWPLAKPLVLAARLQVGSLVGSHWYDIAPSRRLYAGGGSSSGFVRGFAYQSLGPKDPNGNPFGGSALTAMSIEARYRLFGNFGLVTFLDAGQVYHTSTPAFSNLRYAVGIGARYYTSIGPIRIDVAAPVAPKHGEGAVGVYVSIGQAF